VSAFTTHRRFETFLWLEQKSIFQPVSVIMMGGRCHFLLHPFGAQEGKQKRRNYLHLLSLTQSNTILL